MRFHIEYYRTMKRQINIAKETGLHPSTLSNVINGRRRPSWKLAKRLCQAVPGTTPELWLEGAPEQIRAAIESAEIPDQDNESCTECGAVKLRCEQEAVNGY
ncbi:MAG: helix-turn-helix domain-containing protein [Desulfobacterales bacterium]|jgi:DNA-binding XRE family transcriptional regulator|nr:helix-turn-helix domain-containing protein [Desulfobacterales bacterium]